MASGSDALRAGTARTMLSGGGSEEMLGLQPPCLISASVSPSARGERSSPGECHRAAVHKEDTGSPPGVSTLPDSTARGLGLGLKPPHGD